MSLGARRGATRAGRAVALGAALALATAGIASCGSDDDSSTSTTSAQDAYCAAGDQLRTDIGNLADLDLISQGTDALRSALDDIDADVEQLVQSADDAAAPEIEQLQSSLDDLSSSLSDLGGDISSENVSALRSAIGDVTSAAGAVYDTLDECP